MRLCECGAKEGQFHRAGCGRELCPFCEVEFNPGCDCKYDMLGLRSSANPLEYDGLSRDVYENGLSDEQRSAWHAILDRRGRIPFVDAPQFCGRCGRRWPDFFIVQDAAWEYYTTPQLREAIVCEPCFHQLRRAIDRHQPRPEWVPSVEDIAAHIVAWRTGDRATLKRLSPKKFE